MNLLDALRSGKKFKRKHHTNWLFIENTTGTDIRQEYTSSGDLIRSSQYALSSVEILAEDWEVEQKTVRVTEDELRKISRIGMKIARSYHYEDMVRNEKALENVIQELMDREDRE